MAGLLISFEGGEGVGKGTQVALLKEALETAGYQVELTREPGGTPIGEKIRHLLKFDEEARNMKAEAELLLFVAARAQNFAERIAPALQAGKIVICDRFIDSSVVYQGICRGLGVEFVERINSFATRGRKPDLTFLLDQPAEVGLARVRKISQGEQLKLNISLPQQEARAQDRMDVFGLSVAQQLREAYLQLALGEPERFIVVDAHRDVQTIAKEVFAHVQNRLAAAVAR